METWIKRIVCVLMLGATCAFVAACNTTEGVGKDMQKAGEEIEEEADENDG